MVSLVGSPMFDKKFEIVLPTHASSLDESLKCTIVTPGVALSGGVDFAFALEA